jgi:hypothetical protein
MKNFFIASVSLVLLIVVGACNKSSQLDGGLFGGDKLNLSFSDTLITVTAQSESPDSVFSLGVSGAGTSAFSALPWGRMYDRVFGETDARIFANFSSGSTLIGLDSTATYILDSAMMVMAYSGANTYGDTSETQKLGMYRIIAGESLYGDVLNLYSNKRYKTESTPVGKLTFVPKPNSYVRADTNYYRPHIVFKLSDAFGKELLNPSVHSQYGPYGGDIRKFFRGFEFRSEQMTNALLSFNTADDSSGIYLYYKKQNDTTKFKYRFPFSLLRYTNFNHNYALGSINKAFGGKKTASGDSLIYVQGMAGPNVKFEFPNLKQQLNGAVVNRAELEFTILEDSTDKYQPIERFILTTASGVLVADLNRSSSTAIAEFGGTIVTEAGNLRRYKCNISQQLQYMINGTGGTILYLWPDNTRGNAPNKQETTRRVVLYGTKSKQNRAKLNLYYTKP